ncbi:MAG: SPOR domain-containing protein [Rhodobacteraceae bacterium]|nr:SPOR domain-containing protein [Paracoccaceae bacterium]
MSTNVTWNDEPTDRRGVFKLLTATAWAAGSLGGFVVVVMWAYHLGASSPADIPAISAKGDYRIEPIVPGGDNVSGQELAAYGDIDGHASAEEQRAVLSAVAERPKVEDRPVAVEQIETGALTSYVSRGASGDGEVASRLVALDTMRPRLNETTPGFAGAPQNISADGQQMAGFVTPGASQKAETGEQVASAQPVQPQPEIPSQTPQAAPVEPPQAVEAVNGQPAAEVAPVAAEPPSNQELAVEAPSIPAVPPVETQGGESRRLNIGTPRDSGNVQADDLGGQTPATQDNGRPLAAAPAPAKRPQREVAEAPAPERTPEVVQPSPEVVEAPAPAGGPVTLGVLGQVSGAEPLNEQAKPSAPAPYAPAPSAPVSTPQPQQTTQVPPAQAQPTQVPPAQEQPAQAPPTRTALGPASIPAPVGQNASGLAPFAVQIAALETPDAVAARWGELQVRAPDLLSKRDLVIQETALLDPASQKPKTMYRLRVGFPSAVNARNFCLKLRERGIDCYSSPMNR